MGRPRSPISIAADALAAAIAMMDSPASRLRGAPLARELCRLFSTATEGVEREASPDALLRTIADQIRRVVPTRMIRLVETKTAAMPATDALSFDVPSDGDRVFVRLLVDTWPGAGLLEWHFQYLKASAHVLGLIRQLKVRLAAGSAPRITTPAPPPVALPQVAPPAAPESIQSDLPSGWHRVVVRYVDGRMLKGYSREFTVSSIVLQVWPSPNAPSSTLISVPLAYLKAVFFVRDFDGDPGHAESVAAPPGHGRVIAVTFLDGETIVGTTLNYNPDAIGFFIRPMEENNNARVFVGSRAIRHVQFPPAFSANDGVAQPQPVESGAKHSPFRVAYAGS